MRVVYLILILFLFSTYVEAFQPFSLERVTVADDLQTVKDKMNRNSDKNERKDREAQARENEHYQQSGTGNTGVLASTTVYLPFKYKSTDYAVLVSAKGNASSTFGIYYAIFSDSAFNVYTTDASKDFGWLTVGSRKTTE